MLTAQVYYVIISIIKDGRINGGSKMSKVKVGNKVIKGGVKGKQKISTPAKTDKVAVILSKAGIKEAKNPNSRTYCGVAYFTDHRPVADKVYQAKVVLEKCTSYLPYVGGTTRKNWLKVFKQFKAIVVVESKKGNPSLFSSFKFVKA